VKFLVFPLFNIEESITTLYAHYNRIDKLRMGLFGDAMSILIINYNFNQVLNLTNLSYVYIPNLVYYILCLVQFNFVIILL